MKWIALAVGVVVVALTVYVSTGPHRSDREQNIYDQGEAACGQAPGQAAAAYGGTPGDANSIAEAYSESVQKDVQIDAFDGCFKGLTGHD